MAGLQTHTLIECFLFSRDHDNKPWEQHLRPQPIDYLLEKWQSRKPITVEQIIPHTKWDTSADGKTMTCTLIYTVVYRLHSDSAQQTIAAPGKTPMWARGIPCVSGVDEATGGFVRIMAGIFGVPEGHALHTEDTEKAPAPLLSPDFDILEYSDLFNPEEYHVTTDPA